MFKVMSKITNGYWHTCNYPTETEARAAANHAFETGAMQVELYRKTREGYVIIKKARQTAKEAAAHCGCWMADGF